MGKVAKDVASQMWQHKLQRQIPFFMESRTGGRVRRACVAEFCGLLVDVPFAAVAVLSIGLAPHRWLSFLRSMAADPRAEHFRWVASTALIQLVADIIAIPCVPLCLILDVVCWPLRRHTAASTYRGRFAASPFRPAIRMSWVTAVVGFPPDDIRDEVLATLRLFAVQWFTVTHTLGLLLDLPFLIMYLAVRILGFWRYTTLRSRVGGIDPRAPSILTVHRRQRGDVNLTVSRQFLWTFVDVTGAVLAVLSLWRLRTFIAYMRSRFPYVQAGGGGRVGPAGFKCFRLMLTDVVLILKTFFILVTISQAPRFLATIKAVWYVLCVGAKRRLISTAPRHGL